METTKWTYVKLALVQFVALGTLVFLVACGDKGGSDGSGGTFAQTPQSACNVPGQANCNPGVYGSMGWNSPTIDWRYNTNGFCGCAANTLPIYGSSYGLGCVPTNVYNWRPVNNYYGNPFIGYSWQNFYSTYRPAMNYQQNNIPQHYYTGPNSGGLGSCYQQAYLSCNPNVASSCGQGAVCLRAGPASAVGLCVRQDFMYAYRHRYNSYPAYIGYTY